MQKTKQKPTPVNACLKLKTPVRIPSESVFTESLNLGTSKSSVSFTGLVG